MSYFSNFPLLYYPNPLGGLKVVSDITIRNDFLKKIKENKNAYFEYTIEDGEKPETIADRYYGDPELHWIILYMNDIIDPFYDLPLSGENFEKFLTEKYGVDNENETHHYELEDGTQVTPENSGAVPITNREYEERLNESKRTIKILKEEFITKVTREFKQLLRN